ncbi:FGGY-family carbohydrate kinase [Puia sp.]|jgi:autoinducer 2 (AI-2) kinase|uniref:FGGY-family carbohydrate kinase n=1 Tax=Puia sp. TaxID=2045100 RepID=UPI002F3E953D
MEAFLIIDIGTGNARVAVAASDGELLSIQREDIRYEKDDRYPDAIAFDPDALWAQVLRMADKALQRTPGVRLKAFTATSQREGIVLLGKNGESLIGLPNIDHRGREWENTLADKARVYQLTGRYPTSLFSAFKLLGIRHKRAELWTRLSGFLSISDWVQYKLSGIRRYEHSQASETLLYDIAAKDWSPELCRLFDIDPALLPPLQSSGTILGPVLPEYASRWPVASAAPAVAGKSAPNPAPPVVIGGADTQLAIESTVPAADDIIIVSGTTTPVIRLMESYRIDEKQRTWTGRHSVESRFVLEANAGVTGLNYQRLKEIFYPNEGYDIIEQELDALSCPQCVAALGSLIADERAPLTRGGFLFDVPVSHQLTRASFVWATLWDIACCIRDNYCTLSEVAPHEKDYLWACGGGMQSPTLRRLIATLVGKRVLLRPDFRQSSVVGGVYACNKATNGRRRSPLTPEIVTPGDRQPLEALYTEWKATRAAFRQFVP